MLRECPLTHRCMRGIDVEAVVGRECGDRCDVAPPGRVFLDRDGTLIEEVGYLDRPERVELYPWSIDAIRALNRAGLRVVLVTNQSGIARGFFYRSVVDGVHDHLAALLRAGGAQHRRVLLLSAPSATASVAEYTRVCDCRKPAPGLVDRAVASSVSIRAIVHGRRPLARCRPRPSRRRARRAGADRLRRARKRRRPPEGLVAAGHVVDNLVGRQLDSEIELETSAC